MMVTLKVPMVSYRRTWQVLGSRAHIGATNDCTILVQPGMGYGVATPTELSLGTAVNVIAVKLGSGVFCLLARGDRGLPAEADVELTSHNHQAVRITCWIILAVE